MASNAMKATSMYPVMEQRPEEYNIDDVPIAQIPSLLEAPTDEISINNCLLHSFPSPRSADQSNNNNNNGIPSPRSPLNSTTVLFVRPNSGMDPVEEARLKAEKSEDASSVSKSVKSISVVAISTRDDDEEVAISVETEEETASTSEPDKTDENSPMQRQQEEIEEEEDDDDGPPVPVPMDTMSNDEELEMFPYMKASLTPNNNNFQPLSITTKAPAIYTAITATSTSTPTPMTVNDSPSVDIKSPIDTTPSLALEGLTTTNDDDTTAAVVIAQESSSPVDANIETQPSDEQDEKEPLQQEEEEEEPMQQQQQEEDDEEEEETMELSDDANELLAAIDSTSVGDASSKIFIPVDPPRQETRLITVDLPTIEPQKTNIGTQIAPIRKQEKTINPSAEDITEMDPVFEVSCSSLNNNIDSPQEPVVEQEDNIIQQQSQPEPDTETEEDAEEPAVDIAVAEVEEKPELPQFSTPIKEVEDIVPPVVDVPRKEVMPEMPKEEPAPIFSEDVAQKEVNEIIIQHPPKIFRFENQSASFEDEAEPVVKEEEEDVHENDEPRIISPVAEEKEETASEQVTQAPLEEDEQKNDPTEPEAQEDPADAYNGIAPIELTRKLDELVQRAAFYPKSLDAGVTPVYVEMLKELPSETPFDPDVAPAVPEYPTPPQELSLPPTPPMEEAPADSVESLIAQAQREAQEALEKAFNETVTQSVIEAPSPTNMGSGIFLNTARKTTGMIHAARLELLDCIPDQGDMMMEDDIVTVPMSGSKRDKTLSPTTGMPKYYRGNLSSPLSQTSPIESIAEEDEPPEMFDSPKQEEKKEDLHLPSLDQHFKNMSSQRENAMTPVLSVPTFDAPTMEAVKSSDFQYDPTMQPPMIAPPKPQDLGDKTTEGRLRDDDCDDDEDVFGRKKFVLKNETTMDEDEPNRYAIVSREYSMSPREELQKSLKAAQKSLDEAAETAERCTDVAVDALGNTFGLACADASSVKTIEMSKDDDTILASRGRKKVATMVTSTPKAMHVEDHAQREAGLCTCTIS